MSNPITITNPKIIEFFEKNDIYEDEIEECKNKVKMNEYE